MAEAPRLALAMLAIAVFLVSPLACQKEGEGPPIQKTKDEVVKQKKDPPDPEPKVTEPKRHRATGEPCARETKRTTFGPKMKTPDGPPCKVNADCKAEKNGRCAASGNCTYDACYLDTDCRVDGKGGVCVCNEDGIRGYSCLGGNCSVDSDCGKDFCSPTYGMQCGPFTGTVGYYCHSAKDKCRDDDECKADGGGHGYCAFSTELGYWTCGYGMCVG